MNSGKGRPLVRSKNFRCATVEATVLAPRCSQRDEDTTRCELQAAMQLRRYAGYRRQNVCSKNVIARDAKRSRKKRDRQTKGGMRFKKRPNATGCPCCPYGYTLSLSAVPCPPLPGTGCRGGRRARPAGRASGIASPHSSQYSRLTPCGKLARARRTSSFRESCI